MRVESDVVLCAEKLGKSYDPQAGAYGTLRDALWPFGRAAREPVWSLRDVSFELRRGEALAVLGRNGAGKTTLLKILARITRPSEGWAETRGRVSALLEVGTGFHSELTGRENVFVGGALLGMKRREIRGLLPAIEEFADVGAYFDRQIRTYSRGMQLRLAFAVAMSLSPEILLLDEVLAVGDAVYQRKCVAAIEALKVQGVALILVSHHPPTVERLCARALLLSGGAPVKVGSVTEAIAGYYGGDQRPRLGV